jgi:RNA polymerase sigma-70 factor, ECF subfamily
VNGDLALAMTTTAQPTSDEAVAGVDARLAMLLAELTAGRLAALDAIYDAVGDDLFGLALWRTGSRDDAADVVQEVMVRLARTRADLGKVRKPRAYLLGIAHRAAIDVLRRRHTTTELDDAFVAAVEVDHGAGIDAAAVSRLLRDLPAAQREAVYLRHFAELTFAEIGDVTGVPTFTAASRYRLGVGRLRRALGVKP